MSTFNVNNDPLEGFKDEIYHYLLNSPNKERTKKELRVHFALTNSTLTHLIDRMSQNYPIYEDDTGRIIGVLA